MSKFGPDGWGRDRYNNDPQFRQLVDMIAHFIHKGDFTPSEVRDAAMLACLQWEMMQVQPRMISPDVTGGLTASLRRVREIEQSLERALAMDNSRDET